MVSHFKPSLLHDEYCSVQQLKHRIAGSTKVLAPEAKPPTPVAFSMLVNVIPIHLTKYAIPSSTGNTGFPATICSFGDVDKTRNRQRNLPRPRRRDTHQWRKIAPTGISSSFRPPPGASDEWNLIRQAPSEMPAEFSPRISVMAGVAVPSIFAR
jgi:hypothetical protein